MVTELEFTAPVDVRVRRSIADLLPKTRDRCGIYLLEFSDGLYYILTSNSVLQLTEP